MGGGCHRRVVGNKVYYPHWSQKSESPHSTGWYVGDVPIEQAQPSNSDPKRACEDPWTSGNTRTHGAVTQENE